MLDLPGLDLRRSALPMLGVTKLELQARRIWERAKQRGIDPRVMRDYVLSGGAHLNMGGIAGPGF
jgi:hypothetical protein